MDFGILTMHGFEPKLGVGILLEAGRLHGSLL